MTLGGPLPLESAEKARWSLLVGPNTNPIAEELDQTLEKISENQVGFGCQRTLPSDSGKLEVGEGLKLDQLGVE